MSYVYPKNTPNTTNLSSSKKNTQFPKIDKIDPDKKKKKKKKTTPHLSIFLPIHQKIEPSTISQSEKMTTNDIDDIFSNLVQALTIQKKSDKIKTALSLNSKVFGKLQINITTYSTNPYRFHIQLEGNNHIQKWSMQHQNLLLDQLKKTMPNIQIHMKVPSLRKEDRFSSKRKKPLYKPKEIAMVKNIKDSSV